MKIASITDREPDPEVIEQLEQMLELANAGELYGLVWVYFMPQWMRCGRSGTVDHAEFALANHMLRRQLDEHIDDPARGKG